MRAAVSAANVFYLFTSAGRGLSAYKAYSTNLPATGQADGYYYYTAGGTGAWPLPKRRYHQKGCQNDTSSYEWSFHDLPFVFLGSLNINTNLDSVLRGLSHLLIK